jgi:hypothetical protein
MAISPHFLGDSTEILALIHEFTVELKTRSIYVDSDNLVVQELINETFLLAENLRTLLKKNVYSSSAVAQQFYGQFTCIETRDNITSIITALIGDLVRFQSQWSFSYNTWASSYRSIKNNRDVLVRGEEHMQFEFQILFPNYDKMSRSISYITSQIKNVADFQLPKVSDVVKDNLDNNTAFKHLMYKLFGKNPNRKYTLFNKERV